MIVVCFAQNQTLLMEMKRQASSISIDYPGFWLV